MAWVILVLSGVLEAVWASALGATNGFKRIVPTIIFIVALIVSMVGLAFAMGEIPTGTAYAVWVGIGAVLTVIYSIVTGKETASVIRVVLLAALIGSVIGLKVVS